MTFWDLQAHLVYRLRRRRPWRPHRLRDPFYVQLPDGRFVTDRWVWPIALRRYWIFTDGRFGQRAAYHKTTLEWACIYEKERMGRPAPPPVR